MIAHRLATLGRDDHGVATIEFALLSVLFFFVMTAGLDLGMWYQQRLRLDSAVEQGAMVAFSTRANVNQATITSYVGAAAKLGVAPVVTVGCNGGNNNCVNASRSCACVSGTTPSPTYAAAACNTVCGDGSLAGYYLNIKAVATANTMLVPAAMLGGSMVQTRSTVVRLE